MPLGLLPVMMAAVALAFLVELTRSSAAVVRSFVQVGHASQKPNATDGALEPRRESASEPVEALR